VGGGAIAPPPPFCEPHTGVMLRLEVPSYLATTLICLLVPRPYPLAPGNLALRM